VIKVVIADDHTIVREGLKMILDRVPEISVVAEAGNGLEAISLVGKLKPEVVVMDVLMPELDGIESTRRIKRDYPETEIIALSMYADKHFISEMFKAGAKGFLLKDCASTELVEAVYTVRNGDTYLGPSISNIVAKMYVDNISTVSCHKHLSTYHPLSESKLIFQVLDTACNAYRDSLHLFLPFLLLNRCLYFLERCQ
jgi:two-component system response regulator NreC